MLGYCNATNEVTGIRDTIYSHNSVLMVTSVVVGSANSDVISVTQDSLAVVEGVAGLSFRSSSVSPPSHFSSSAAGCVVACLYF